MSRVLARVAHLPSLAWNLIVCRVLHFWNWWDEVDSSLYVGAQPLVSDIRRLLALDVRGVINMCEEFDGHVEAYSDAGITQLHLPTTDFTAPSLENIQRGIQFIDGMHAQGHAVYIHCKAGRGRSATVALCWLMHENRIPPSEALRRLATKRRQVSRSIAQRRVVQQYWELVSQK